MTSASLRGALFALLLISLLPAAPAGADVVVLSAPFPAVCVASPGAVYTIQQGALHPTRGLFSVQPPGSTPITPRLIAPAEAQPGQLVRFYVSTADALDSVSLTLRAADGSVLSSAQGFRVEEASVPNGAPPGAGPCTQMWAALLGIPSWAGVRDYTLTVTMSSGLRTCMLLKTFAVTPRVFRRERFGISPEMTALLTVPDYRKDVESRTLARVVSTPHLDARYETGPFAVPLPTARRTSGFGDRREYVNPDSSTSLSIHIGVDMASQEGTKVPACGAGRVVFAFKRILTGNTVVIEHLPGLFSVYFHLSAIDVSAGQVVAKGQIVGRVGMTGFATGPHLHWEIEALGVAVDPDSLTTGPLLDKNPDFNDIEARNSVEGR
jgi:murein DD-endopeptidase MepM/ murein hydrolase activator NlpD